MSDLPNRLEDTTRAMANLCAVDMALWCNHSSAVVEAAARIRLLEQQLSTAREEALEEAAAKVDNLRAHLNFEQFLMILRDKTQAAEIAKAVMAMLEANAAAIRSLGEPSAHPPGE